MGSLFVDCWDKLGFSKFGLSHSTIMARSNSGEKTKKNLVGSPPFLILDFMAGKKYGSVENGVTSTQRTKATIWSNLWSWANLYSVDDMNSFLDFFDLVGLYMSLLVICLGW